MNVRTIKPGNDGLRQ